MYYADPADLCLCLINKEHRAIYAALTRGDSDQVIQLLHEHRSNAIASLQDVVLQPATDPD